MKRSLLVFLVVVAQALLCPRKVAGSVIKKKADEQLLKTYFENAPQNVFASAGQNILLPCRVRHLNDKVVSWIRMRDLHILTSGQLLFTNDCRFGIQHPLRDSAIWNLQIKDVSPKDMGSYECQVNTEPKIKFLVNLTVFESDVMIGDMGEANVDGENETVADDDEQHKKTSHYEPLERRMTPGGSITFTCRIGLIDQARQSILWYHDNKLISILDRRGSLSVETDRSSNYFASRLTLASVTRSDSGKYTCKSGNKNTTTFTLHVISPDVYINEEAQYPPEVWAQASAEPTLTTNASNELALQDGLTSNASRNFNFIYAVPVVIIHFISRSTIVL